MFEIITAKTFEKDVVRCEKRGLNIDLLQETVKFPEVTGTVPEKYKPHILSGKLQGFWECHVKSDWLLIWTKNEDQKMIYLARTGTHSDLF